MGDVYLHRIYFTLVCLISTAIFALFLNNNGNLLVTAFEGDAMHQATGVLRLLDGEVQHIDFHTPLGILSFLPARILMSAGLGFGMAVAYSNLLVAAVFLPVLIWVGETRFTGALRYYFALVILLLFMAMARGGADTGQVDVAMYYNRWCWAVSGLIIAMVMLDGPDRLGVRLVDGMFLGLCFGFLALTKATFFVFLAPAVLIGLLARQRFDTLAAGLAAGVCAGLVLVLLTGGTEVALAYIADLRAVSSGDLRSVPSLGLLGVIGSPEKLAGSIAVIAAGIGLRSAGHRAEGLFVIVLFPALALITVQNWGNFGQWVMFLGLVLWARIGKDDARPAAHLVRMSALAMSIIALPQIFGMSESFLTHKMYGQRFFVSVFDDPRLSDFQFHRSRLASTQTRASVEYGYEADYFGDLDPPELQSFMGETLPNCAIKRGMPSFLRAIAEDLSGREDVHGKQVLYASSSSLFWLFGGTERLTGGQLWYYGDDTGFENAEFLVVPFCAYGASGMAARQAMLQEIESNDKHNFVEVDRTDLFILYRRR